MMATQRRRVSPERGETMKLKRDSVGSRIAKQRYKLGLTQDHIAAAADRGRSAVAQWERDDCEPPLDILRKIADILETTPQWLAFGMGEESSEAAAMEQAALGLTMIPETVFGGNPGDRTEVLQWGIPTAWLKNEGHVADATKCIIYKVEYAACGYEFGDHLLVDTSATRPSPPGNFLHWDGIGPVLATMTPTHGGGRPTVRVSGSGETFETEPAALKIIGRVRAVWRKS